MKCKLMCVFVYYSLQELMKHSQAHFTVLIQLQDFRQKHFVEHNSVCQDARKSVRRTFRNVDGLQHQSADPSISIPTAVVVI